MAVFVLVFVLVHVVFVVVVVGGGGGGSWCWCFVAFRGGGGLVSVALFVAAAAVVGRWGWEVRDSRTMEDTGAFDGWWVRGVSWRFVVVVDVVNARMDRMWVHEG